MRFSQKTMGFYEDDNCPKDAIEISPELYQQLLSEQSLGKKIVCDDIGLPFTIEDLECSVVNERVWRNGELFRADIEINKIQDSEKYDSLSDWKIYRNKLRAWPQDINFPSSEYRPRAPDATTTT